MIGPSVAAEFAAEFAQWARVQRPDLGVILLRNTVDSEHWHWRCAVACARSCRRATLPASLQPFSELAVVASAIGQTLQGEAQAAADAAKAEFAAEAAAAQAAAEAPVGRCTLCSRPKGGVGKSLVATNIAVALADAGSAFAWSTSTSTAVTSPSCCSSTPRARSTILSASAGSSTTAPSTRS